MRVDVCVDNIRIINLVNFEQINILLHIYKWILYHITTRYV